MVLMFIGRIGPLDPHGQFEHITKLRRQMPCNMPKQTSLSDRETYGKSNHWNFRIRILTEVLKTLQDQDVDIVAIDDHADVINQYESMITTGIVGDITELDLWMQQILGTVTQS